MIGIVLAAGSGTRFGKKSKLFVDLCGQRVLDYPINLCKDLGIKNINLVVKKGLEALDMLDVSQCNIYVQSDKKGTGAAVQAVISESINDDILILLGDCPLVDKITIQKALNKLEDNVIVIGGVQSESSNNHSYGRIKLEHNNVMKIEEATVSCDNTKFRNAGWMLCKGKYLHDFLRQIPVIHGEYYLTECVRIANDMGFKVGMVESESDIGINTRNDYVNVVQILQNKFRMNAIDKGALMLDPTSVYFSANTVIEHEVQIDPYVVFKKDVILKSGSTIKSFSHIESSVVGANSVIGPFANIRSGTYMDENVEIGAFVETKNSYIGSNTKAKHLSYIGNADIGENVNIGAGSVFCNYDGLKKNKSIIGDNSFLGANTSYVAPIDIGSNVKVGAGSVVTKNVSSKCLVVARADQKEYKRKV
ncbi:NTP transferase domain-containing protein [Candidatus Cytomitobacter primus]|uniref:Bifunctional N-acetylglucosamine-1-phosphate uridyltransferase/glucosamine-1-phosphate acetyltransferase n=1 Tax=Candidatus Cytomitobacter primus TaxID=2066024 RepID=A0A5C0UE20_9PROT|nr:NTP transferase domain-containing protein [Candidatus Cytomitobacter primus]QEK38326.1 bifunctional N-acetylglucosamine-1-phosphate uridyltransferase/glucosamine-1-phosphate acetyltransferase [Candidatus Cytomitobacter primus]